MMTVERLRKMQYIFFRLRDILELKSLKAVYYALSQSILQYGIVGWGGAYENALTPLKVMQRSIIKIILKKPPDYPTSELYRDFPVLSLERIFKKMALVQIYKDYFVHNLYPRDCIGVRSRGVGLIKVPLRRTTTGQHHYSFLGVRWYNELESAYRYRPDVNFVKYRENIKEYILSLIHI